VRLAVISDIHGNLHALESVWGDLRTQSPDSVMCLGDLVGYGAYPNQVIDFVRGHAVPVLMGNYDDGVGYDRDDCGCVYQDPVDDALGQQSLFWTRANVTGGRKAYLRSLPFDLRGMYSGRLVRFVHGSPRKINEYLYEDRPQSVFEHIARVADCDVLFFGHTHLPYQKQVGQTLFVNAGSVGKPKDGDPRAGYLIADFEPKLEITLRRVTYDVAAAARAVRESGLPTHFADLLETGGVAPEAARLGAPPSFES
jgi:putative phosphoesterase